MPWSPLLGECPSLDVLFAGGDAQVRAQSAAFLQSIGIRPLNAGGLEASYVLEWAAILLMGLARNGAGWNVALGAEIR